MLFKARFTLYLLVVILAMAACTSQTAMPTEEANMPNPASVYCEQQGNRLEIRTAADGSQSGFCIFPDGSECDEWAYYRGECKPGGTEPTAVPQEPASTEPAEEIDSFGWKIYRNEDFGYSFHYPADASIVPNDDPLKSISVIGPLVQDEYWPQFTLSHPSDREDYRPPEGADLAQWLADHNLLGDERLADMTIAGTTAIHLRHDRSPQSYAYDRYFFAHEGQLYMLVIGHAGDKEDWELYNRFLESIAFE